MKQHARICLIVLLFVSTLLVASCENKKGKDGMNDMFLNGYAKDDSEPLEKCLTKEYELNELKEFFEGKNANENTVFCSVASELTFSEVNQRYPVEIFRTSGYTVYKVSQGGYYYVFWIDTFATDKKLNSEPRVYFSAYLPSSISHSLFDSLTPGVSTAEDVKKLDPSFELSFLLSSGIFSYSYLNDETILQVKYAHQEKIDEYSDLIVREWIVVPRESVPSRYSVILPIDIP